MKVSFFAAASLLLVGVTYAKVFARFTDSYECGMADGKAKYNVEKTECITGEPLSNLVKISKITRKQRHLCLIKFTGDGCLARSADAADREEAQQLEIPNNEDGVCVDIGTRTGQNGTPEKEYWKSFKFGEGDECV